MTKGVTAKFAGMAAVFCGVMMVGGCGDDHPAVPTVKAPPGAKGPTTQEVLAQRAANAGGGGGRANPADLEPIPELGKAEAFAGADGTKWEKYPSGLMMVEEKAGEGELPKVGQAVAVSYVGTLPDGKEFDRSKPGEPLSFVLGKKHSVIEGWSMVVSRMEVGGKMRVWIPAELAYGAGGSPPKIGPNQPLIFEMELKSISGEAVAPATQAGTEPATRAGTRPATAASRP